MLLQQLIELPSQVHDLSSLSLAQLKICANCHVFLTRLHSLLYDLNTFKSRSHLDHLFEHSFLLHKDSSLSDTTQIQFFVLLNLPELQDFLSFHQQLLLTRLLVLIIRRFFH